MINTKYLIFILSIAITVCVSACSSEYNEYEPTIPNQGNSLANDEIVNYNVAYLTELPTDYADALNKRMPVVSAPEDASIVMLTSQGLSAFTTEVIDSYFNGGIVVIVDVDPSTINSWFEQVNLNKRVPTAGTSIALYAFGGTSTYLLDECPDGLEFNETLNEFVNWVNSVLNRKIMGSGEITVADISTAQTVTHTLPYSCKIKIAQAASSDPDYVCGKGRITAAYSVYPLFQFPQSGDTGEDFYVVEAEYRVESGNMTNMTAPDHLDGNNWWPEDHMWISKHGGSYNRIYALYLTNYWVQTELLKDSAGTKIPDLIFASTPVPSTSLGSTNYTVKSGWTLGSTQGISGSSKNGAEYSGSYTCGLTYGFQSERNVADVQIGNNQSGATVKFAYDIQNLPEYEYNSDRISIRKAPIISIASAKFPAQWIWRVPETKVNSTDSFVIHSKLQAIYGSFHYWAWGTYYSDFHDPLGALDFYEVLTPPNRTPTGLLQIQNTTEDQWITEVTVTSAEKETPIYQQRSGSTAPGKVFNCNLPVGKYDVTLKMSKKGEEKQLYHLATDSMNISFASTTNLPVEYSFTK